RFIGKEAMAAVSGANPIMFLLVAALMGVSLGFSILVSQFYGSGDLKKVKATIDTTYILLFIGSILISILGIVFGGPMLRLMNTPESVFSQSKLYLTIIFGGILFSAGYNSVSAILRGLGDSITPLYFLIIATILNIVLDLTFIVVLKMGVEGVALATIIAQAVSFIISIIYLNKKHEVLKFKIKGIIYDNKIFKDGLRLGLPSGVQQMLFSIGNMALQFLVNSYGTSAMAAFGAGLRIENFISLPIMNLGSAVSTFVAQNIGAGENERVKKGIRESIKMTLVLAVIVIALILLFRENLIALFNTDKDVIKIGSSYLFIIGPFFLFIGTSFVLSSAMKGAGDSMFALISSIVSLWLGRLPASYMLSRFFGTNGIWMGIPFGWTLGLIVTVIYYNKGRWKTKAIVNHRINK
ncbi:TPA: MATE family efflux transporter, partial [Clostridioides difficile]|nr:MATE family efflux transporter [Clostridioides difficile]